MMQAKTIGQKIGSFVRLRPSQLLSPVIGLLKGLTDPVIGLLMGQTAENLAWRFGISREQMDQYSVRSHQRAVAARTAGHHGRVTPGNSSQITDGAAWLILASQDAVDKWDLKPLGRIIDSQWAGLDPAQMGLGPVHAATPILQRQGLALADVDLWEINEAFAAQVLGCLAAWESDEYCREQLDLPAALGKVSQERLNVDGSAIAVGHPVGASGARIVLHLLHALRTAEARRGMAAICIGGGQGGAMLVETMA